MKTLTIFFASILAFTLPAKSQVYSTSQSNSPNGLCIGCNINNASYSVDVSLTNFETMNLTVAVVGAGITQRLNFPSTGSPTYYVGIVVEDVSSGSMNSALLNGITLTTYKSGISNDDTKGASALTIAGIGGSLYKMEFQAAASFDAVQVNFNAGILNALTSLRLYYGYYKATSPLPIELLSFAAKQDNNAVRLSWATATEQNNDHFTIERSTDALTYETVGTVDGTGNSSIGHSYDFSDKHPEDGINYYRLKQTDYDGHSNYFNVITADYTQLRPTEYAVYPNPATNNDEIHFVIPVDQTQLTIINLDGQTIFAKTYATGGNYTENLSSLALPKGIYFATLRSDADVKNLRLVIQ